MSIKATVGEDRENFIKRLVGIPVRELLVKFIEGNYIKNSSVCLDIGSGSGNEVIYLLGKGHKVIAIDGEKTSEEVILSRINSEEKNRFQFKQQKMENLDLPENIDLAYTFYTLQFCEHDHFDSTVRKIQESIKPGGFFVGNFLGMHDDRQHLAIKEIAEIKDIFHGFDILSIEEKEYDREKKSSPKPKHRHEIEIIAQKK